jgi:hypothetical protein
MKICVEGGLRSHKYRPTANDFLNFTDVWDIEGDSINSKRRQLLEKVKDELPAPKMIYDPMYIEDKTPVVPVEFYENDDGFWDDYIKEKESYRATVPLPTQRPFYKH